MLTVLDAAIRARTRARVHLAEYTRLVALLLAGTSVACGGSSPTEPSAPSSPPSPVLIHNSLNSTDDRTPVRLYDSVAYISGGYLVYPGGVIDDFTPKVSAQVRQVRWQGGYCDPRFRVPLAVPPPVARSFWLIFSDDLEGAPAIWKPNVAPLSDVDLPIGQVIEERMFDVLESPIACSPKVPASFSYYSYSATLPTPVSVQAGRRYWLMIRANIGSSDLTWGWRAGVGGDGRAFITGVLGQWPVDMAFSLSQ